MFKRVLSVLMSLVLIVCLLPVGALSVAAEDYGQICEDCPITVFINQEGDQATLYFMPDISGEYSFYSYNNYNNDTYGTILDSSGCEIYCDDDSGGDMNFRVTGYLNAGELYQLCARFYGSENTGSFDVAITREYNEPNPDDPYYPDPDYPEPDYPGELMPGPLEYNNCTYEFDGCSMRLIGYHGGEEEVWIPDQVYGYPVNCIGAYAFAYNSEIRSVYYSGDSLYIEEGAFTECCNLERVELSAWMDCNIGRSAFEGCTSLHDIRMDGCYYGIDSRAFARCESLGWVVLPENMHYLGSEVFESCWMLSDVTLSNSMYEIPYAMFLGCESLQEIRIPQSVNFIGMSAFASCGSLSTVYYDGSYTDREAMMIEEDNQPLLDARWVYSNCEHIFDNACDPTCNLCGEERYVSGHEYDNACDSVCDQCGEEREVTHQYDNRCDTTCNVCGAVRVAGHTYANDCDPTCEWCGAVREVQHDYDNDCDTTCNVCGEERGVNHQFDNGCDTTCNMCTYERDAKHTYDNDCDAVCNVCGEERVVNHTYDNGCDTTCNVCGEERVTEHQYDSDADDTCNDCGEKREVAPEALFSYTIVRGQANITKYNGAGGDVVIPSTLAGYPVVAIGDSAFDSCLNLVSVTIPDSVTNIGDCAFGNCEKLTSVTIGGGVTCIGFYAFSGCVSLASITIPDGVTTIGNGAFEVCTSLISVTLPKSVVSVGAAAFNACNRLIDVWYDGTQKDRAAMEIAADYNGPLVSATWHYAECEHEYTDACDTTCMWCEAERTPPHTYDSNVDTICNGCGAVREIPPEELYTYEVVDGKAIITGYLGEGGAIEIPATIGGYNVAAIGDGAFRGVTTLTGVVVPNGVTSIYSYAFSGCYNLASIRLPESVLSIDTGAFEFCESLTTFTFPSGVVSIAEELFHACYRLETVTLPDGVTKIGDGAFVLCTSLKSIDLPNSLEVIGNGAFNYCESLESIVVPYQVWSIGDFAFDSCYGLQSVNLPMCLSYLGENAFAACSSLQSVSLLGSSVRVLRAYTFQYCTALTAVSIPAHTYSIDETAFLGCDGFVIRGFSESYAETFAAAHGIPFELVRQAQFTVGTIKGAVGTSVKVPVYVDGNPGISGVTFNITYDRSALTYTGYEYGDYYGFMHCDGTTFGWVSDSGDVKHDGVLVYLLFDVKSTASLWTNSKISISFDEQDVHNEAQQPVTFKVCDGAVQIVEFTHMELVAPTKRTYQKGDRTLDLSGGKVLLYRADGTVEELELTQSMVYGFDPDEMGTQAVEVSYRGCSASFYVEIVAPSVTGVAWESKPNRVQYVEGGTLDVTGGVLKVTYSDGSTETVNVTERMVSGFDGAVVGTQTLAVKYREFTLEYTVTVVAKSATSIALTTLPNVREYVVGKDKLTVAGGKLTVYYNNGTSEVINLSTSMVSGFNNTVVGEQTLTVTYNGFTATYTVTVIENNAPTFVVDTVKGRAGNTVTVAVRVKNNPGIASLKLKIGYDTSVLSLVSAQLQDFTGGASGMGPLVSNPFIVNWVNTLGGNNTTDGVVVNLTFRIAEDAALGETAITVTYDEDDVYDENYDNVFFRTESGAVDVVDYTSGDINDDGSIDNKDLGLLFQYLNFWDVNVVIQACDVNRDGAVNNKDLGLLMRYLNGWNVELK